ncbi:AraC family transcriptional regulator ligand-binding domain-containing protein [Kitasatospora sp. KL5]|uniref:AraC family transcriptional regulator n=1 Tax=Kitasatospora sp. KL5 TaxID=3425125 RepID=UPI003D6EE804
MGLLRSATLRNFRALVGELGGSAEDLAGEARLPVAALDADEMLVDGDAVAAVLELAALHLACPDFGLRLAARQDLGVLGPLALAIQSSRTIGDGLECTSRYLYLHGRSLRITVEADPHGTEGVIAVRYGGDAAHPVSAQSMDQALGFTHRVIATLVGGAYGLRSVELPHPPLARSSVYESFFGVETRFRRPDGLLRMPHSLLSMPLGHGDETLRALALAYLARQAPEPAAELAPRVHAALARSLGAASAYGIDSVARLLSVHPRTLQRRLAAEGTAFAAILDDVRRDAARRYLVTSDLPMYQIASLLGLSEQSALSRCCRRWWGMSPSQVRREARQGSAATGP